jgi:hypothetical protein
LGGERVLSRLGGIAVALDVDELAVVQQPVVDGGGDHGIPEELLPVGEAFIFEVMMVKRASRSSNYALKFFGFLAS